jgi:DNA polymerase
MSLELDNRQRAMLREMGLRVWSPQSGSASTPSHKPAPVLSSENAVVVQSVAPALKKEAIVTASRAADSTPLSWSELHEAVMQCQRCKQSVGRRAPVFAQAEPGPVDWLVLGEPPDDTEERLGQTATGQAGLLLDNMLKAVGVGRSGPGGVAEAAMGMQNRAYLSNVVKCRPAIMRNPDAHDLASCENHLRREVALLQPKVILALGRFAAQALLQGDLSDVANIPLGKLRGQVYRYQGIPVVVSYHPSYLLRTPQDKGRAWLDLCLALQQFEQQRR